MKTVHLNQPNSTDITRICNHMVVNGKECSHSYQHEEEVVIHMTCLVCKKRENKTLIIIHENT